MEEEVNLLNAGVEPRYMGISPIYAIPKVLEQVGLTKEDIDVYEVNLLVSWSHTLANKDGLQINEAFASQFAYCVEHLGISIDKINPKCVLNLHLLTDEILTNVSFSGGAISISHPLAMSE